MRHASKTAYRNVATVVKTKGTRGEIVVRSTTGLPFALPESSEVFFNPPSLHGIHRACIESISSGYPDSRVKLVDADRIDDVADLAGKTVLVHREDYRDGEANLDVIGREVVCTERGVLGKVVDEFCAGSANRVWTVDGPLGEVLVPVIDDVVIDIPDDVSLPISVHLPYGLVDDEAVCVDTAEDVDEDDTYGGEEHS